MKVGSTLIFLFRDHEGFGAAIYEALQSNHNSSLQRSESAFEFPLERYGIKDHKANGDIAHFVDNKGEFVVSVLLMQYYEPPILACAINEVLESIAAETPCPTLTVILPFVVPASKIKCEEKITSTEKSPLYVKQIGPGTELNSAIITKAQKLPSSLQIHYEPLACLLQFVHALKFSTTLLIAQSGQRNEDDHKVIRELGGILASSCALAFLEEKIKLNPGEVARHKATKEPWRALYG